MPKSGLFTHSLRTLVLAAALLAGGCAAMAPLIPVALDFARNMLKASSDNHGNPYATVVGQMLARLEGHALRKDPEGPPAEPLKLEVAMSKVTDEGAEPVEDGATLRSGDIVRVQVKAATSCHLYVLNVDGSGAVYRLRPGEMTEDTGLVAGETITIDSDLDEVTGTEHVYFVATLERSEGLEAAIREIDNTYDSNVVSRGAKKAMTHVTEPAIVPGGVDSTDRTDPVQERSLGQKINWHTYLKTSGDLVVTRYFKHVD